MLLSFLIIFHREVCLLPFSHILILIFYCEGHLDDGTMFNTIDTCKGVAHMILMTISGLLLFLTLLLVIMSSVLFNDTQPDSKLPWANCGISITLLKQLKKISIAVSATLIHLNSNIEIALLIIITLIQVFIITEFTRYIYMNNSYVREFMLCFESSLLWICVLGLVKRIFILPLIHDIYIILSLLITYALFRYLISKKINQLIYTTRVDQLLNQLAIEQYILFMAQIFHKRNRCKEYIAIQGVFANHIKTCKSLHCPCEEVTKGAEPMGIEENASGSTSMVKSVHNLSVKQTIQRSLSLHSVDPQLTELNSISKKRFFEFLKSLIEQSIRTIVKPTKLYIQLSYIHYIFLENKFIALYDLMNAQDTKPSLIEEFLIYRLKYFLL